MSSGRDLVVVKQEMVQREFDKLGMRFRSCGSNSYRAGGSVEAREAGYQAGDRASFGRPVGAAERIRLRQWGRQFSA
jgi:hypothetical protein